MKWVIGYDIHRDKTRRRVARRLERMGFRRQRSVFEGEASPAEVVALLDELADSLGGRDALTAWPMVENGSARVEHRGDPRAEVRKDWIVL